jgi:hypothetical protein
MNQKELELYNKGDSAVFKAIAGFIHAADAAEALNVYVNRHRKRKKKTLSPSTRMALLNSIIQTQQRI